MKRDIPFISILIAVLMVIGFATSSNAQSFFRKLSGKNSGTVINLQTTATPKDQFTGLPNFTIRFEDKRTSDDILQKFDGGDSKPNVSTDVDVFDFVKSELSSYMGKLGFPCSESGAGNMTLIVTLDKFDVGYYSGKGWAGNVSLGMTLNDNSGNELYAKEINRGRVQLNESSSNYSAMENAINSAWNSVLESKIEWQTIATKLREGPALIQTAGGGNQIINVTNVYNQQTVTAPSSVPASSSAAPTVPQRKLSDVDENIPTTEGNSNSNTFVLIIANENYKDLQKVNYALYDAETFKDYCIKTLGIPKSQIFHFKDATYGEMGKAIGKLEYVLNEFDGKRAIVYYCGHGTNDESTGKAYIVPVDGDAKGSALSYCMEDVYKRLSLTKATSITYFLDACFSGAGRDGGMLVAARGTARAPKKDVIGGTTIVFSATSNDETAMGYDDKSHGLFTYHLLKALQDSKGNITYENLYKYISEKVKTDAFLINEKPQHPMIATSPEAMETWKNMTLK